MFQKRDPAAARQLYKEVVCLLAAMVSFSCVHLFGFSSIEKRL